MLWRVSSRWQSPDRCDSKVQAGPTSHRGLRDEKVKTEESSAKKKLLDLYLIYLFFSLFEKFKTRQALNRQEDWLSLMDKIFS